MKIEQCQWRPESGWDRAPGGLERADLILGFGGREVLQDGAAVRELRQVYPHAHLLGCSTAGEIRGVEVCDGTFVATILQLEKSTVTAHHARLDGGTDSHRTGQRLAAALDPKDLVHVFVLSDGLQVNGSELVAGLVEGLPEDVTVTGGLSGDADRFEQTLVIAGQEPEQGVVGVLGFHGQLDVGYASLGGWDPFGPERMVTRSEGNVLFELDGQSALELYKRYLGEHAEGLPATGLLFPLALRSPQSDRPVVRTILSVDEEAGSMTFAGDLPQGHLARLMKANFDRLVEGAGGAAQRSCESMGERSPDLAILISCVGRKMVLKQRVEEEVEAVRDVLGEDTTLTGFYSYGEISPFVTSAPCELHNQTMTITALTEV